MTEAQARERARSQERSQANNERIWLPRIEAAQKEQLQPVLVALKQHGSQYVMDNLLQIFDPAPMSRAINDLWLDVGIKAANSEYAYIMRTYPENGKSFAPDMQVKAFGFNRFWASLIQNLFGIFGGEKVADIGETERRRIRRVLIDAQDDEQNDFFHLSRRLLSEDVNLRRARLITRTESGNASSAGGEIGARQSGLLLIKRWVSVKDKRTRRIPEDSTDHVTMNGKKVGMDEKFLVPNKRGANMMSRPHDLDAPASQVCNCRCKCVYEPARDANGRLIRVPRITGSQQMAIS